jgi:hypothetical protein
MAPSVSFKRSNALTRGLPHFPFTSKRRPAIALISLVVVLFAVISGAVPAMASSMAYGSQGMPVLALKPAQPGSPTGLTAMAVSSSEIDLSWTASSDGSPPAGYNIYEGTSPDGESNTPVNPAPVTDTTFPVTDLASGTTYYFLVLAVDAAGFGSDYSNEASATTFSPDGSSSGPSSGGPPSGPSSGGPPSGPSSGGPPSGPPSGGPPSGPLVQTGGSSTPWSVLVVLIGVVLIGVIIVALIVGWRSRRTATTPQPASGQSVQAVAHAGPPGPVTINATGTGATLTVRVQRHPSPGATTIEEVPPP